MGLKTYLVGGAVIAVLAIGYGAYRQQIKLAEERGARAEVVADYRQLQEDHAAFRDSAQEALTAQAAESEKLRVALDSMGSEYEQAKQGRKWWFNRYQEIEGELVALPDTVREAVAETIAALEEEAETCSLAFKSCNELVSSLETEKTTLSGLLTNAQLELSAANQTISRLEQPVGGGQSVLPWVIAVVEGVFIVLLAI